MWLIVLVVVAYFIPTLNASAILCARSRREQAPLPFLEAFPRLFANLAFLIGSWNFLGKCAQHFKRIKCMLTKFVLNGERVIFVQYLYCILGGGDPLLGRDV
jgi:hypothetical protein